jgi:hypothetical protein
MILERQQQFILISVKINSCQDKLESYYGFAYVENNPVKAKMVENATDYKYSSAMYHAGLDIFSSEESIYPTDNYPFDNEKMNDSGEAATVIR